MCEDVSGCVRIESKELCKEHCKEHREHKEDREDREDREHREHREGLNQVSFTILCLKFKH